MACRIIELTTALIAAGLCFVSTALAGDGLVALQTADPSCPDDSGNIYIDCGNGTVTDNRTGLVWLKRANCFAQCSISSVLCAEDADCPSGQTCEGVTVDWHTAMDFVAGLSDLEPDFPGDDADDCGLADGSSPGEWRLPSASEWEAMMADAKGEGDDPDCVANPPTITNDSGLGCWADGPSSFIGVQSSPYSSATTYINDIFFSWYASPINGTISVLFGFKTNDDFVWPVRGGQ